MTQEKQTKQNEAKQNKTLYGIAFSSLSVQLYSLWIDFDLIWSFQLYHNVQQVSSDFTNILIETTVSTNGTFEKLWLDRLSEKMPIS